MINATTWFFENKQRSFDEARVKEMRMKAEGTRKLHPCSSSCSVTLVPATRINAEHCGNKEVAIEVSGNYSFQIMSSEVCNGIANRVVRTARRINFR